MKKQTEDHKRKRFASSKKTILKRRGTKIQRFWARVKKTRGCWIWTGGTSNGYAYYGGVPAYRMSWEIHYGKIPKRKHCLHRCDNPLCVKPTHLFLGTNHDNVIDSVRKGRHWVPWGFKSGGRYV